MQLKQSHKSQQKEGGDNDDWMKEINTNDEDEISAGVFAPYNDSSSQSFQMSEALTLVFFKFLKVASEVFNSQKTQRVQYNKEIFIFFHKNFFFVHLEMSKL